MQVRKVFKAGNSFAVSIPSEWVRQMNLEDQPVELLRNDRGEIIVKPSPKHLNGTWPHAPKKAFLRTRFGPIACNTRSSFVRSATWVWPR